jgi:hypothetical protein
VSSSAISAVIVAFVLAPLVMRIASNPPVYRLQETDSLLEWLAAHRRPGDAVYVWYRAAPNVLWYGPRMGLPMSEVVWGGAGWKIHAAS